MWFKTPDILAVHNCYFKAVPAIVEGDDDNDGLPGPGIGGGGHGLIVLQPQPLPTVINQNPPYRIGRKGIRSR
jgi:hypothetical protein